MVWQADGIRDREAAKVRFDLVRYARGRAVDIGCGQEKVFPSFLGVDNCQDNVLFRTQVKPDLVVEDGAKLQIFSDGSFDCTFSSHTLDRIVDWTAALAEWWRITKVGGYLILYLPHRDLAPVERRPDEKHRFVPAEIVDAMRALGGWELLERQVREQDDEFSFLLVFRKRADGEQIEAHVRPKPEKSLAVVRLGAFGDALWLSSALPALKAQGYHITVYTQEPGELVLRHDPNIDDFVVMSDYLFEQINLVVYWLHESRKFDRFLNLVGSVETRLLPTPKDFEFYWTDEVRRRVMNVNYLDTVHDWCGVADAPRRVRFTATEEEFARAQARRDDMKGPVCVLNAAGSGQYKWWPHAQKMMDLLAQRGVHCVVIGDNAGPALKPDPTYGHLVGRTWGMRDALAFAQLADIVIGTESAIVNAVSFEPMLKIVLLSHSTDVNLTRDWPETVCVATTDLDCYPCHRIHTGMEFCTKDQVTRAAACMAAIKPETLVSVVDEYLAWCASDAREAA